MSEEGQIGRNEPCPCGSGKKYKRCCGVGAAPKLTETKKQNPMMPEGFDPSQIDQEWLGKMQQMMGRLPKSQMQRIQSVMQKAMAGKDVSAEAAALEGVLPPEFQEMLAGAPIDQMMGAQDGEEQGEQEMNAEDAAKVVEDAIASGQLSEEEGKKLLEEAGVKKEGKLKKLWKGFRGK